MSNPPPLLHLNEKSKVFKSTSGGDDKVHLRISELGAEQLVSKTERRPYLATCLLLPVYLHVAEW